MVIRSLVPIVFAAVFAVPAHAAVAKPADKPAKEEEATYQQLVDRGERGGGGAHQGARPTRAPRQRWAPSAAAAAC